jgi:hypothetical protein
VGPQRCSAYPNAVAYDDRIATIATIRNSVTTSGAPPIVCTL